MTNEDFLADLKQFIAATISQQLADFATKEDLQNFATKDDLKNLATKDDIQELRNEMNEKFEEVQEAIAATFDGALEGLEDQFQDHEKRILKLETSHA